MDQKNDLTSLLMSMKKKDEKQQAQLNKCLNEKRRREQENFYIEELAEYILASNLDMSSFSKPDKCAILQETVNTIQQISKEETVCSEAVQQSQVSSSKPSILASNLLGPLLLETLDSFLFVVNSQGRVTFVSENVKDYLKYIQDDLVGKSIYNIIHVGDHAEFSNYLKPMSLGNIIFPNDNSDCNKAKNFSCRMLIKPACEVDTDIEVKQSYVCKYESMHITAVLQPYLTESFSESYTESEGQQRCLVCIARRLHLTEKANMMIGTEHLITKQDLNGKILEYDSSHLASNHRIGSDFIGQLIQDFCHANDIQQLNKHFQEVRKNVVNTSGVFRLKLLEGKYVFVRTKSKLVSNRSSNEPEYIISTHQVVRDCDSEVELKGSASSSLRKSIIGPVGNNNRNNNMSTSGMTSALPMGVLGVLGGGQNNFIGQQTSNPKLNVADNLSGFDNWDSLFGSDSSSDLVNSLSGATNAGNSINTSNPWASLPKMSPSHSSSALGSVSGLTHQGSKKPAALSLSHRTSSLSFDGQASPGYPVSSGPRSAGFQVPSVNRIPGYSGQRSPGSAGQIRGQFMMPAQHKKNPLMSPPSSTAASTWGRSLSQELQPVSSSVSSHSPHRSLEHSLSADLSPRYVPDKLNYDTNTSSSANAAAERGMGKLCQLLTQDTSFSKTSALYKSPKMARTDSTSSGRGIVDRLDYSPFDNISQSPQPGTGTSSPEKPQSTSEENDAIFNKVREERKQNLILKKLLSQEDEGESASVMDQEVTSSPQTSNENDSNLDLDRNEAEAKKPSNAILKQLLNEEDENEMGVAGSILSNLNEEDKTGELLQKLLQEEENNVSTPGETTIREADSGSRSRHQSGHQDPQPSSSSGSNTTPQHNSYIDENILRLINSGQKASAVAGNIMKNKNLDQFFNTLWEKDSTSPRDQGARLRGPQKKRKASATDVDSTDMSDTEPSQSCLAKNNAILAHMLSKKTAKENMVLSTQQTVKPTMVPQDRLPKNIIERIIQVKTEKEKEGNAGPNSRDNPSTNPNIPFPGNTKTGQSFQSLNENSEDSMMSSESNQLDIIQQLLNQSESMEVDNGDSNDPLLQGILQQAAELEQDINSQQQQHQHQQLNNLQQQQLTQQQQHHQQQQISAAASHQPSNQSNLSFQSNQQTSSSGLPQNQTSNPELNTMDDSAFISQLEQLLGDNIDNILVNTQQNPPAYNSQDASDQMAINAIQRQLMGEDLNSVSNFPNNQQPTPSQMSELLSRQMAAAAAASQQHNRLNQNMNQPGMGQIAQAMEGQFNHMSGPNIPGLQSGFNQSLPGGMGISQSGARFNTPQGMPGQAARQQMFRGMNHSPMGAQVRQNLIQKQKQKDFEKLQRLQAAERQRLLQQQQPMRHYGPRFPSGSMDGNQPPFPENLNELMNTGHAPNVTLPVGRGKNLPSPVSPRYSTGGIQQPPLSPMLPPSTPPSQLSPHFNSTNPQQWNMRGAQPAMSNQYNLQRHRSLSGGNVPSRFTVPDSQFTANQTKMMMSPSAQNQQMYARQMLQRQISLPPGRGSPRTPHSPFGNSPDPMLMSPNNNRGPGSQVSPTFSQGGMSTGYTSPPMSAPPSYSASSMSTSATSNNPSQHFSDFDLTFIDSAISGMEAKKNLGDISSSSTSQYVKQELRNKCNARSEKQHQSQQQHQLHLPVDNIGYDTGGELPLDILETINDMAKEHGNSMADFDDKNEDPVSQSSLEARKRYEQFRALSNTPDLEEAAAKVFRNQLRLTNPNIKQSPVKQIGGGKLEMLPSVNVVQKEPRTPIEDIKPADQKNSLLQQLLSE